jgi:hypothetical protein
LAAWRGIKPSGVSSLVPLDGSLRDLYTAHEQNKRAEGGGETNTDLK